MKIDYLPDDEVKLTDIELKKMLNFTRPKITEAQKKERGRVYYQTHKKERLAYQKQYMAKAERQPRPNTYNTINFKERFNNLKKMGFTENELVALFSFNRDKRGSLYKKKV